MAKVPECEICGSREARFIASIQGARLSVCPDCAKSGKILQALHGPGQRASPRQSEAAEPELVPDFPKRIKQARERIGVSLSVLAERISEKESYLDRVERGATLPSELTARKLEKELGIKLFEMVSFAPAKPSSKKDDFSGPTLGDMVIVKKKKKG